MNYSYGFDPLVAVVGQDVVKRIVDVRHKAVIVDSCAQWQLGTSGLAGEEGEEESGQHGYVSDRATVA